LKKQLAKSKRAPTISNDSEGGPYIPVEMGTLTKAEAEELFFNLDRLAILKQIVGNLPLAKPVEGAEEQSPFGRRIDPFTGHLAFHSGLDLVAPAASARKSTPPLPAPSLPPAATAPTAMPSISTTASASPPATGT